VAKLHKVPTEIIFDLLGKLREVHAETRPPGVDVNLYRQIILSCVEILSLMGLYPSLAFEYVPQSTFLFFTKEDERMLADLQATVEALDLFVISYSGAHICSTQWYLDGYPRPEFFALPDRDYYEEKETEATPIICLRPPRLMCMDAFLGEREVWVFQERSDMSRNAPLWLSTGIEELNDLWGPCWKSIRNKDLARYKVLKLGMVASFLGLVPSQKTICRAFLSLTAMRYILIGYHRRTGITQWSKNGMTPGREI